ncbi:MAG: class I SAM-dependent DNA methyltransferase, partial [Microthrixaceae bacterium]
EENRSLYAEWAATYDADLLANRGYVHHLSVVDAFLSGGDPDGPVLDAGCGTGVVGIELRRRGLQEVDGIDLSPEMLDIARTRRTSAAHGVYRNLITADLTGAVALPDSTYAGVVSAGAFTHGHLGPDPIEELLRVARPGARFAIGINADHYEAAGFAKWFTGAERSGLISAFEVASEPIYDQGDYNASDATDHADTMSAVALFTR